MNRPNPSRSRRLWTAGGLTALCLLALGVALATGGGCRQAAKPSTGAAADPDEPTQAQPKLRTLKLWLGPEEMVAELALTEQQMHTGMMFRTNLAENCGMLFPLPVTQQARFWMKNCPLPLSAAYIDASGVIREIHDLQPQNTNEVVSASQNIRFVLETPQGWFERHHLGPGTLIRTERGPLFETFFGQR
jgi:uncharacterized membrane protein (UPF0127 family)